MKEILDLLKGYDPKSAEAKELHRHLIYMVEGFIAVAEESAARLSAAAEGINAGEPLLVDEHLRYLTENAWRHIRLLELDAREAFKRRRRAVALSGNWGDYGALAASALRAYGSLAVLGVLALPPLASRWPSARRRRLIGVLVFVES